MKHLNDIFIIKILIALVMVWVSLSCNGKDKSALNDYTEFITSERNKKINIKHQLIDLTFDWKKRQAYGHTNITLATLTSSDTIYLDAGMLTIVDVKLNNETPLSFDYDGSSKDGALKIILDKKYAPNTEITLNIGYTTNFENQSDPNNIWGSFGKGIRFFEPSETEKERRKQIWSIGEPDLNRYWYPSYDAPNDLRTTEFKATIQKPLMAISNGRLVSTIDNQDGSRTYHWKTNTPHANHLTSFVIGDYKIFQQDYNGIKLNNYGYPDEYIGTRESVVRLPDMMQFFSNLTGKDYPYESYSQIFVQDFGGYKSGVMSSTITENMIDDKTTHEDFLYFWDLTQGESLAHQWFGNLIGIKDWGHVWLNKGFSRHVSGMYNEYKNGKEEFLLYQHLPDLNTYLNDWNSNNQLPVVTNVYDEIGSYVNGNIPYSKGALVLNMLRKELGEDKWKKVIKNYVDVSSNRLVSTKDFIDVVNEVHGEPMYWFFDQWVYKIGHPKFLIKKEYNGLNKKLTINIKQTQKRDSTSKFGQVDFFKGKMNIEIDEEINTVVIEPKEENIYVFDMDDPPTFVNVDFESTWIKELVFEKRKEELIAQLRNSQDVLGKVSAMTELASIAKDTSSSEATRSIIKNELRNVLLSKQYWRARLMALWQLQGILSSPKSEVVPMEKETVDLLLKLIREEQSWLKSNAINVLGMTKNSKYLPIYMEALSDYSDRVVNMAAIALGKTKSPKAFHALVKLKDKPSWKNQSLISALDGLKELQDPRGYELAIKSLTDSKTPHWNLGTPIWDHRLAAAQTLVAIGKVGKANELILKQFRSAFEENNINDMFYNALQISILGHPEGKRVFQILKEKYKADDGTIKAVNQLEINYLNNIK